MNLRNMQTGPQNSGAVTMLILLSCVLTSFFGVSYAKAAFNYRATSQDYFHVGIDSVPELGMLSVLAIFFFAAVLYLAFDLLRKGKFSKPLSFLYKHRFVVGACIVAIATLFELSGSSIACMSFALGDGSAQGVLFGMPRTIRSDEWLVFTPFAFSQENIGYAAANCLMRGVSTDVTLVYAQPCWSISTIFRPFLWGYLLLGSAKGLAFFWSARLVCLFLASESFAQLLFGKSRKISVSFAALVAFAGTVQWWFAVNGVAELIIFGELLVICFYRLLGTDPCSKRLSLLLSLAIAWLCVSFALVLYPAWQVVLFWFFFSIGIARSIEFVIAGNGLRGLLARFKPLVLSFVLVGGAVAVCFIPVADVVRTVNETVYPGSRINTGGDLGLVQLGNWARSIFSPLAASAQTDGLGWSILGGSYGQLPGNVCEGATFFSPAPLGCFAAFVLSLRRWQKKQKVDYLLILLALLEAVLAFHCFVGLPKLLVTITLLSHSAESRIWQMLGYLDLILLFRSAVSAKEIGRPKVDKPTMIVLLIVLAAICLGASACIQNVRFLFALGAAVAMFCLLGSLALIGLGVKDAEVCLLSIALFVAVSGASVNPVQQGAYPLTEGATAEAVSQANEEGDIWIAESSAVGDLCIAQGSPCINSVNTYPSLATWQLIDPMGVYSDIYNRYAHIAVKPTGESVWFELTSPDAFTVHLTLEDARKLGVTKWITSDDLSAYETDKVKVTLISEVGGNKIWNLEDR